MITLIKGYKYDNNYNYVKTFQSKTEQENYFSTLNKVRIYSHNYVKEHVNSFKVEYSYDDMVYEGFNYITFINKGKTIYAFITSKEYLSEDVTRINFEVDVIQTYMFDFNIKESFIERKNCTVNEICDFDEGLECGEHEVVSSSVVHTKEQYFFAMFSGFREDYPIKDRDSNLTNIVNTTYNIERPVTDIDGVKYPMSFMPLGSWNAQVFSKYLMDAPNLLGIIVMPKCNYTEEVVTVPILKKDEDKNFVSMDMQITLSTSITSMDINGGSISVAKSEVTDFYPYTYYVLTDGECDPLIMKPQHCASSISIKGKTALSHTPVQRFYPSYYKGDTTGNIYNITNSSLCTLPTGGNNGLAEYATSASQISHSTTMGMLNVLGGVGMIGVSAMTGNVAGVVGGASTTVSAFSNVLSNMKRIEDMELTPSTIKSYGTPSTRNAFGTNTVKLIKYSIGDKYKNRIKNFIDRYGNKYNNYGLVDIKSYKGFIKYTAPDLDGAIDNAHMIKITEILERGVFIE